MPSFTFVALYSKRLLIDALDNSFYSDKTWIHLDGCINSQNYYHLWASENPNTFVENGLHPQKVGMWRTISQKHVVGPFFFRETINADRFQVTVTQFIASLNRDKRYCIVSMVVHNKTIDCFDSFF